MSAHTVWALFKVPADARPTASRLRVGQLIGAGKRFATIETVFRRRVPLVLVLGLFDTEGEALKARDEVEGVDPWNLIAQMSAVKAAPGWRSIR